jgi:dephospho-CoA kinase
MADPAPFRIALTGGIASGKTTVANLFAALGVPVIDTDVIARQVVEPGQSALAEVVAAFGPEVLDADGRIDRRRLRERIFADPACTRPSVPRWSGSRAKPAAPTRCW